MANIITNPTADPILQTLQAHRDAFWRRNEHLSEPERQQLWHHRKAQLVSSLDNAPFPSPDAAAAVASSHPRHVPRTMSYGGLVSHGQSPALQIPQQMDRSTSHHSVQSAPASYEGYLQTFRSQSMIEDWESSKQEPFSAYTIASNPVSTPPMDSSSFDEVPTYMMFTGPSSLPPTMPPALALAHHNPTQQLSVHGNAHFGGWASPCDGGSTSSGANTPTTGELTTRSTVASSDMSRQSSISTSFRGAFHTMHVDSSPAHNVFEYCDTVEEPLSAMSSAKFVVGLNESDCSQFPLSSSSCSVGEYSYSSFLSQQKSAPFVVQTESDLVEDMKRSASAQSTSSAVSTLSRVSQRRHETLVQSSRPIAPKEAKLNTALMSRQASDQKPSMGPRPIVQDGSSKNVAAITKAPASKAYVRPRHPKILCPHCDKYPEGFRGEHELRRHVDSKHAKVRKVWICVDASENKNFLSSCKQCRNKKQYGAYYNAAAHLRRAHFHPRKRGRKSRNDSEKRGGKGGGNDPPMDVLKKWMKEIEVLGPDPTAEDEVDSSEDNDTDGASLLVTPAAPQDVVPMSVISPDDIPAIFATNHHPTATAMQAVGYGSSPYMEQSTAATSAYLHGGFDAYPSEAVQANFNFGFSSVPNPATGYVSNVVGFEGQQQFEPSHLEPFLMDSLPH